MIDPKRLREEILQAEAEAADQGGVRLTVLRRALGCRSAADQRQFREVFRALQAEGLLLRKRGGRYVPAETFELIAGTITVNSRGFGFVAVPGRDADIFIPPKELHGAISGDTVMVAVTETGDERGPSGTVRKIVERKFREFVGCIDEYRGQYIVRPLRRELPATVPLAYTRRAPFSDDVSIGDWVLASLKNEPEADSLVAEVSRKVADGDTIDGDLDAVTVEFSLPEPYTAAEEEAAARLTPAEIPREDLTGLDVITIDPADAKDYDDAISLAPGSTPGRVAVGVHIADVAAYVPPGSPLDEAARKRGFTAYLPGRTLPMLPTPLAANLCSLLEGEVRPAHSVLLEIDAADGRILARRRCRSLIRVTQRLSFADADALLSGAEPPVALRPGIAELVRRLGTLAEVMRSRRSREEGFLPLALPEVRVLCAEHPARLIGLSRSLPTAAHNLVEEFMLAANSAVAEELLERNRPGLFRVHAEPKTTDLQEFRAWAGDVLGSSVSRLSDRQHLNRFLLSLEGSPLKEVVYSAFLRVLPRAGYAATCDGHFGLGKERYAHFTSPIRRYPDLAVHQQLLCADLGRPLRSPEECAAIAASCTERETTIDNASYAATDRLKIRYVEQQRVAAPGLYYEGTVCRLVSDGLLLHLPDLGLQGFLPGRSLPGGPYRLHRSARIFQSPRGGKKYKCGDVMYVQVRRADPVRGELSLEPLQARF